MTIETCPYCGAERQEKPHDGYMPWRYECGTLIHTGERLKANCYRSQIEQQAAEIERLKQAVLDEREACAKLCVHIGSTKGNCDPHFDMADECAEQIRARGEVK
jgi:hypothetical protein